MVTDNHGLKRIKIVINQSIHGLIRTFEELEVVPIIGVEPTTFYSNDWLRKSLILRIECAVTDNRY